MNRLILGIDPGTTESGWCFIESGDFDKPNIVSAGKTANEDMLKKRLNSKEELEVVIEGMANQARGFGESSIKTCYFIGRLIEICDYQEIPCTLYKRHEYGRFFVNSGLLKDATLRAALETIWGPSAKKNDPLYALRGASDKRSAFALAKYHEHCLAVWGDEILRKTVVSQIK